MNCLSEAIGLALPGNGTIPAVYAERLRLAKYAGMKVMELVEKDIKPRDIITLESVKKMELLLTWHLAVQPTRCYTFQLYLKRRG